MKFIFDYCQLIKPDTTEIAIKEDFGLVVFWDPSGTKVLKSTLVAFDSVNDSSLSVENLYG